MQGVIEKVAILILDSCGCVVERYIISLRVSLQELLGPLVTIVKGQLLAQSSGHALRKRGVPKATTCCRCNLKSSNQLTWRMLRSHSAAAC